MGGLWGFSKKGKFKVFYGMDIRHFPPLVMTPEWEEKVKEDNFRAEMQGEGVGAYMIDLIQGANNKRLNRIYKGILTLPVQEYKKVAMANGDDADNIGNGLEDFGFRPSFLLKMGKEQYLPTIDYWKYMFKKNDRFGDIDGAYIINLDNNTLECRHSYTTEEDGTYLIYRTYLLSFIRSTEKNDINIDNAYAFDTFQDWITEQQDNDIDVTDRMCREYIKTMLPAPAPVR